MTQPEDRLIRTMTDAPPLRAVAVLMTDTCAEGAQRHGLRGAAAVALGRGLMSGMLMATLTKGDERVTLQVMGDGPLGGITVDANDRGEVRGYVGRDVAGGEPVEAGRVTVSPLVGERGELVVHRDLGLREIYQGRVDLSSGEVDEDLERYLAQSEQMGSVLRCEVVTDSAGQVAWAGGVLVQTAPGAPPEALQQARAAVDDHWVLSGLRGAPDVTAALSELCGHALRMIEWRRVCFRCRCDAERVAGALATLGGETLREMIAAGAPAEVICRFCATPHQVPVGRLDEIRQRSTSS